MNEDASSTGGASVDQINLALEEIECALERLNALAKDSAEFRGFCDELVQWKPVPITENPARQARMQKLLGLINAYHSVWNLVCKCPLASISLAPVSTLRRRRNDTN